MADERRHVKVYAKTDDQEWKEVGMGQISAPFVERLQGVCLLVQSESDGSLILESKIHPNTAYQKEQEVAIVWFEAKNHAIALSFQDPAGCREIWEDICQAQGKDPTLDNTQDISDESEQVDETPQPSNMLKLPDCYITTLGEIANLFISAFASPIRKERLTLLMLEDKDYVKRLLQLFPICENLNDNEALQHLHTIIKRLLFLNNTSLFQVMFSDEYIMNVVGCLEYDPALAQPKKYREFLTQNARIKEVIPIRSSELRRKINQTYRVQYIHDILFPVPSIFEKNLLSALTTFIFFNKVDIVSMLQEDDMFFSEVFAQLRDKTIDDDKRRELLFFFKEFCEFSQILQPQGKTSLFKTLIGVGIIPVLKFLISMDDFQIKRGATNIFTYLIEHTPSTFRGFVMEEAHKLQEDELLINVLIKQMICDTDPQLEGAINLMGLLRSLLDPNNMLNGNEWETSEFLNFFYRCCMHNLVAPLLLTTSEDKGEENDIVGPDQNKNCPDNYQTAQLLGLILELLTFCVQHHRYYIKNYILSKNLLRRVLTLMSSKHTFLILCAVRFLRRMIGLKDELYNSYIIKGNLFEPVVNAFLLNGTRYNMLNSAIIELFEYVREENIKSLVAYIVENFYKSFELIEYVKTFKGLKIKYEEEKETQSLLRKCAHFTLSSKVLGKGIKVMEVEEEMSFKGNTREADMPPMGDDFPDHYDKLTETERREENEDNVDLPKRSSSGGFRFSSYHSAEADNEKSSPHSSTTVGLMDYPDGDNEEDKNDEAPPRKIPHLSSQN